MSAPRPCTAFPCKKFAAVGGKCADHAAKAAERASSRVRGSPTKNGYNYKWRVKSKAFLVENPVCTCGPDCCPNGCGKPANVCDHKVPHNGDQDLFWDENNWQPRYKPCHDRKTATHDGGFGKGSR